MQDITAVLGAIGILIGIFNTIAIIIERWQRPSAAKIEKLICDVDKLESVAQRLESEIKHLPTIEVVNQLTVQMTSLTGQLRVVETELQGAARAVRRVEDHFLAGKM